MIKQIVNEQPLGNLLKSLCLPTFASQYQSVAESFEQDGKTYTDYLQELAIRELEHRHQQRIARLLKQAKLSRDKLLSNFDIKRIPGLSSTKIQYLVQGEFMDRYENILIFGNPGTGKSHLSIGLAREWCLTGRKVFYTTAASLVQQLLEAKSNLRLRQIIKKFDYFEILMSLVLGLNPSPFRRQEALVDQVERKFCVSKLRTLQLTADGCSVIDDISYVPYSREETDVLFTLLAERYEMRSVLITSNLVFAKWNTIFKDDMTTSAAIDRLVHHSTILELNTESYRIATAKEKKLTVKSEDIM